MDAKKGLTAATVSGCDAQTSSGNDADHSMFCQLYRCYAYEVGCCEGRVIAQKSRLTRS